MILDRSRGPSSRTPDRTNSFWISAESARARFRRRKSADASITAFIPLSVRVNGAGRSTGCCCGAGLRRGAFGRRGEGIETEASRRSRSRHTSSYSWNKGCSCSSFRSSSRRSRSALIRSVIRYSCSNELKRELLVARKAACKDRQPSAGAGHLRHFPLQRRDRLLGIFPVTLTGDRRFESGLLQRRVGRTCDGSRPDRPARRCGLKLNIRSRRNPRRHGRILMGFRAGRRTRKLAGSGKCLMEIWRPQRS